MYFSRKMDRRRLEMRRQERLRQLTRPSEATGTAGPETGGTTNGQPVVEDENLLCPIATEATNGQPAAEDENERNKREADIKLDPEFVRLFYEVAHEGRVPPDPSVLPETFVCIHCERTVKREENDNPFVC